MSKKQSNHSDDLIYQDGHAPPPLSRGNLVGMRRRKPRTKVASKAIKKAYRESGFKGSLKSFARTEAGNLGVAWLKNKAS